MLQNHKRLKDSFRVQAGPVDLNVTEYEKFVDTVSDSTLQLTCRKSVLIEFWCSSREYPQLFGKAGKDSCPFLTTYSCGANFLHILQQKQHIVTD